MNAENRYDTAHAIANLLHGAVEVEKTPTGVRTHRLPARARAQAADPQLDFAESQPSGVRLVFRTDATFVELRASAHRFGFKGLPPRPDGVFDLVIDGRLAAQHSLDTATASTIDPATGGTDTEPGGVGTLRFDRLPAGDKHVEIWLPHNETVELASLSADAPLHPVRSSRPVWVHHGSSISQGSNAEHPTGTWPAIAASLGGVELVNLGFGGSALLDPFTARAIRDTPADLISLKLGINVVNADLMRRRAFVPAVHGFLDTIRDGHPDTPLLVVSPLCCPIHEDTPGPGDFDRDALAEGELRFRATGDPAESGSGKLTLAVIREELSRVVDQRADPNLHYLDGLQLYGEADAVESPMPDRLHPDAETHRLIGRRFAELAFARDGAGFAPGLRKEPSA
ncbi:GDSL-type esterase/lipase family protein [Salininema proteolyticum]|uniref:GDSL-type esterase/lipase family protein n=1 Tax=Salininema proteolyticum TaxID=1607685 RepID=A0ABV8TYV0_9ACTN